MAIFFIATPIFLGCNDEPASIGLEILPSDDLFTAEMQVEFPEVMNVYTDGILSDGHIVDASSVYSFGILGYFNDPRFGKTKAELVTEVSLTNPRSAFKENNNFMVDSVILSLCYSPVTRDTIYSWVGDSAAIHHIKVFELSKRLPYTGKFYSNTSMVDMFYPELLAEKKWAASNKRPLGYWKPGAVDTIKIKLSTDFANKILNLTSDNLLNRDSLKNAFHGFYITVDDPANPEMFNSLLKLNLISAASNLKMYYHEKLFDVVTNEYYGKQDFSYTFPINSEARMFNRFEHDAVGKIAYDDPTTPFLYVQNMAGSYVKFDLSDKVTAWKNALEKLDPNQPSYGISSVELVFEADTFTKEHVALFMPKLSNLVLYEKKANGELAIPEFVNKYGVTQSAFIRTSATYNKFTNQFVFKMVPDYFVKVAKGEIDPKPFYLRSTFPQFNFNRIVLINNEFPEQKPKVNIKYVIYK